MDHPKISIFTKLNKAGRITVPIILGLSKYLQLDSWIIVITDNSSYVASICFGDPGNDFSPICMAPLTCFHFAVYQVSLLTVSVDMII